MPMHRNENKRTDETTGAHQHVDRCGPFELLQCLKGKGRQRNETESKKLRAAHQDDESNWNRGRQQNMRQEDNCRKKDRSAYERDQKGLAPVFGEDRLITGYVLDQQVAAAQHPEWISDADQCYHADKGTVVVWANRTRETSKVRVLTHTPN